MSVSQGSVVRAKAGRDKDQFFVVLDVSQGYALIADGKRRKVENPKRKKLIHLAPTNITLTETMDTNRKIRKALCDFGEGTL